MIMPLNGPIDLGISAETRHCYDSGIPGYECLTRKPVKLNKFAIDHITEKHPERHDWLPAHIEAISTAIARPEIISAALDYKPKMNHWAQSYAIEHPTASGKYLLVIVSLARADGDKSEYHQVVTAFPAEKRKFYNHQGVLHPKWRKYKGTG